MRTCDLYRPSFSQGGEGGLGGEGGKRVGREESGGEKRGGEWGGEGREGEERKGGGGERGATTKLLFFAYHWRGEGGRWEGELLTNNLKPAEINNFWC